MMAMNDYLNHGESVFDLISVVLMDLKTLSKMHEARVCTSANVSVPPQSLTNPNYLNLRLRLQLLSYHLVTPEFMP